MSNHHLPNEYGKRSNMGRGMRRVERERRVKALEVKFAWRRTKEDERDMMLKGEWEVAILVSCQHFEAMGYR